MSAGPDAPPRGPECPAAARLEAFSAGDEAGLQAHVTACPHCAPYVERLRAGAAAFRAARPPELFLRQVGRRRPAPPERRWGWPALAGAAVALGLGAVIAPRLLAPDDGPRLKGAAFHVYLKRGAAEATPVVMDQTLRAGDQVRFAYQSPHAGHLVVLQLDGTERVDVRYPQAPSRAEVEAGHTVLPGAVALDAAPGPEWFVSVFSTAPLDVEGLRAQLRGQARSARIALDCGGCQVEAVRVGKEAP